MALIASTKLLAPGKADYVACVRNDRKLLLAIPDRRKPARVRTTFVVLVMLAIPGWLAWKSDWFAQAKRQEAQVPFATAPVAQAIATSPISTTIVRRAISNAVPTNSGLSAAVWRSDSRRAARFAFTEPGRCRRRCPV